MKKISNFHHLNIEDRIEIMSFLGGEQSRIFFCNFYFCLGPQLSNLYNPDDKRRYLDQVFQVQDSLTSGTYSVVILKNKQLFFNFLGS